jgi:hypothetical protein
MTTVSVLLPVYSDEPYLETALKSIFTQTFTDYELIVVAEDLAESTAEVLTRYQTRIDELIELSSGTGLSQALNIGIDHCEGQYIARMDADDINYESRLEKQLEYLQSNPGYGVVSSHIDIIDESGRVQGKVTAPPTDTELRWELLFSNPLGHSPVMLESDLLQKHDLRYRTDNDVFGVEDYALWTEIARHTKFRCIQEKLLKYRVHEDSITQTHAKEQNRNLSKIAEDFASERGYKIDSQLLQDINGLLYRGDPIESPPFDRRLEIVNSYLDMLAIELEEISEKQVHTRLAEKAARKSLKAIFPPCSPYLLTLVTYWQIGQIHPNLIKDVYNYLIPGNFNR